MHASQKRRSELLRSETDRVELLNRSVSKRTDRKQLIEEEGSTMRCTVGRESEQMKGVWEIIEPCKLKLDILTFTTHLASQTFLLGT